MHGIRKYIRIKLSKPITLKFRMVSGGPKAFVLRKGKSIPKNISAGGVFVEMPKRRIGNMKNTFLAKHKFLLELEIPGYASRVKILGKTAWVDKRGDFEHKKYSVGIQFEKISEGDRERLLKYMLELLIH